MSLTGPKPRRVGSEAQAFRGLFEVPAARTVVTLGLFYDMGLSAENSACVRESRSSDSKRNVSKPISEEILGKARVAPGRPTTGDEASGRLVRRPRTPETLRLQQSLLQCPGSWQKWQVWSLSVSHRASHLQRPEIKNRGNLISR